MACRRLRRALEASSRQHRARLRDARVMPLPTDIELRSATFDDIDWLDDLHTLCMREKVERVYPWDPDRFRRTFDPTINYIIVANGRNIGLLSYWKEPDAVHVG